MTGETTYKIKNVIRQAHDRLVEARKAFSAAHQRFMNNHTTAARDEVFKLQLVVDQCETNYRAAMVSSYQNVANKQVRQ